MPIDDGSAARRYHEATKHSVASLNAEPHGLDWANQPLPFKVYSDLPGEELPKPARGAGVSLLAAISSPPGPLRRGEAPGRGDLARLLHFSLGIVRRRDLGGGHVHFFRAAPCTGALYHIDAYLVCGELRDLAPGVYHFGPQDFSLRRLRAGDFRGIVGEATGGEERALNAPLAIVLVSTYWRNAWKYRSRAYRHVFWDGGTVLAQLLAIAAADRWPAAVLLGFAGAPIERLCGLDPMREGAVAIVPIGSGSPAPPPPKDLAPISHPTKPLSKRETDYPAIREVHAAGALANGAEARRWRARAPSRHAEAPKGPLSSIAPSSEPSSDPIEDVILRRGSTRWFSSKPIRAAELVTVLRQASAPLAADYRAAADASLVDLFVIVNAVEGIPAGAYRWRAEAQGLEQLSLGERRRDAGFLALGQALGADAATNVYAMADLERILPAFGTRGYRAAELEGGIAGGRIYLSAYAQGLGATGLTFFDDDVSRFFDLDPARWGVMFLTAVGVPRRA